MKISLFGGHSASVDELIQRTRSAAESGFDGVWFAQHAGIDALTALTAAAIAVPGIELGTAVVPIQGRHPIPLAQQALTVASAAGAGRFTLGIGVTHAPVSEDWYGIPYEEVVALCANELAALGPLLRGEEANVVGTHLTARLRLTIEIPPPGLVLAALGPRMLDLAGRFTDGTVTWMTGPALLRRLVVPRLRAAAAAAGRGDPRVVVGTRVVVTDDEAIVRKRLRPSMVALTEMRSYHRTVTAEGVDDPVDLAIVGDERAVGKRLDELEAVGATELLAHILGDARDIDRTTAFLCERRR